MKLYYSRGACSFAVRILIHELNLEASFESVNLQTKKTETGENYLTINPKGSVPALLTKDNEILTENAIIHQYLADTYKAYELLPPVGDFKRYRILEWVNFVATELHKGFGPFFNPAVTQEMRDQIFIPIIKKKLDIVNYQLEKNKYLAGDHFTLPDAYMCVISLYVKKFEIEKPEWTHLSRYFAELRKRKSVHQSLEEEHLE
jgi:glutathione S-transferase